MWQYKVEAINHGFVRFITFQQNSILKDNQPNVGDNNLFLHLSKRTLQ